MWLIPVFVILILAIGVIQKIQHQKRIDSIPIRVNINGIRGKSTVTRLITGIIAEADIKVVGKTTGTSARMIYWFTDEEKPIKRRPEGANINEQLRVVNETAKLGAEALVSECMAVNPDYQIIFQNQLLQANIGVIVNVLEDHMDVMGPTLDEIAEALSAAIPRNGYLVISEGPYVDYYKKIAAERNTEVVVVDPSKVSEDYLRKFEYMLFPENVALAMGVAQVLGIDEKVTLRGMLNAHPDPGAMRILPIGDSKQPSYFVNGFAANDATSTLNIWKRVEQLGYPTNDAVVIMNARPDRVDRTEQFARDVLPYIPADKVIVIGENTLAIKKAFEAGKIPAKEFYDFEGKSLEDVMKVLSTVLKNRVIYGVGNIHGAAEPLIEKLEEYKIKQLVS